MGKPRDVSTRIRTNAQPTDRRATRRRPSGWVVPVVVLIAAATLGPTGCRNLFEPLPDDYGLRVPSERLKSARSLDLEERVELSFRLPGTGPPVKVTGRVAWISEGSNEEPPGMGIQFEGLDASDQRRINELVLRLRAHAPGVGD